MSISACYITKNGDEFLETSMQSIRPYVDEIILADDMSTDKTIEIAERYDAKIIQMNYSELFPMVKTTKGIAANKAKLNQRNDTIKAAKCSHILIIDDDEVYDPLTMERMVAYSNSGRREHLRHKFHHFWKSMDKKIVGHMWDMQPERFYKREDSLIYLERSDTICYADGRQGAHVNGCIKDGTMQGFHYSYMKDEARIVAKIRAYLLRDNPNVNEKNVDEWMLRHPYLGGPLNQPRYGTNGLYIAGRAEEHPEKLVDFPIDGHPYVAYKNPLVYRNYIRGANQYMEGHWQFHNHLDYPRHQARLKYTAEFCVGDTIEVGCANGFSTATMQAHVKSKGLQTVFSGYELTDWGYKQAIGKQKHLKFYKGLGEIMPFSDGAFDTVLQAEIIEHCMNPRVLADEGFRVAKRRYIVTTPTKVHPDPDHKRHFPVNDMIKFLEPYGSPKLYGLDDKGNICDRDWYFLIAIIDKEQK